MGFAIVCGLVIFVAVMWYSIALCIVFSYEDSSVVPPITYALFCKKREVVKLSFQQVKSLYPTNPKNWYIHPNHVSYHADEWITCRFSVNDTLRYRNWRRRIMREGKTYDCISLEETMLRHLIQDVEMDKQRANDETLYAIEFMKKTGGDVNFGGR